MDSASPQLSLKLILTSSRVVTGTPLKENQPGYWSQTKIKINSVCNTSNNSICHPNHISTHALQIQKLVLVLVKSPPQQTRLYHLPPLLLPHSINTSHPYINTKSLQHKLLPTTPQRIHPYLKNVILPDSLTSSTLSFFTIIPCFPSKIIITNLPVT